MALATFLLAAGYGQRLRPLTERIAKPVIPFLGKSALEINAFLVEKLEPKRALVNSHHLPEQIDDLAGRLNLEVLHEADILGTGGCLDNASPVLKEYDTFLVHNADILHTIDLKGLLDRHLSSGAMATLAGVFRSAHNTLSCTSKGQLLGVHGYQEFDHAPEITRLTFAGIAFYQRDFLRYVTPGPEDIKRHWLRALKMGGLLQVVNCSQDANWYDFGTPQGLWDAAKFMMEATGQFSHNYHPMISEPKPFVSNEAGQEDLPDHMRNVLILEETAFPIPSGTKDCILGRDFRWGIEA
jgi:NDP-sugar pyrophosphorylase family protein